MTLSATRMKRESILDIGRRTRWMALGSLSGRRDACTSVSGPPIIKMASGFCLSKVETSMLVSLSQTRGKATGITRGPIIVSLRAGGMKISSMDSASTLVLRVHPPSLEYGRWANESNGYPTRNAKA